MEKEDIRKEFLLEINSRFKTPKGKDIYSYWAEFAINDFICDYLFNKMSNGYFWKDINIEKPKSDGQYLTFIKTDRYDNIGFTQYVDNKFMSSFVTHWIEIKKP